MWSEAEKAGCRVLLNLLNEKDVFSLFETATQRRIYAKDKTEAISAIIAHSESAKTLLRRKKVLKETLIKYIFHIQLPFSTSASKEDLVDSITEHWNRCGVKQGTITAADFGSHSIDAQQAPPLQGITQPPVNIAVNVTINNFNEIPSSVSVMDHNNQAKKFVSWFYHMLNSLNPLQNSEVLSFGPQHFWENAQLCLRSETAIRLNEETVAGSASVAERLAQFTARDHLLFNPNVSDHGVDTTSNPYGFRLILACGSLHKNNNCVGIFQQSFGLVKDPRHVDSWKIMVSFLRMQELAVQVVPSLQDCRDVREMQDITSKALEKLSTTVAV